MNLIPIVYVGSKESQPDIDYGTGLVWNGKGDVQQVPEDKAPFLLNHPDVWADARSRAVRKSDPIEPKRAASKQLEQDQEESLSPVVPQVHLMGKMDLQLYARTEFNEVLDDTLDEPATRAEVVRLMQTR